MIGTHGERPFLHYWAAATTALIFASFWSSVALGQADASLTAVVDKGDAVPGGSGTFQAFNAPGIDEAGRLGFQATGFNATQGIYVYDGVSVQLVANYNTDIPGPTGQSAGIGNFALFQEQVAIHNGRVAFKGYDSSFSVGRLYTNLGGNLRLILGPSINVPDAAGIATGSTFTGGNVSGMNESGLLLRAFGTGGERGFYLWTPTDFRMLIDLGAVYPGTNTTFDGYNFGVLDNGELLVQGIAQGSSGYIAAIAVKDTFGNIRKVADSNTPIPGGSGSFSNLVAADLDNGEAVFRGVSASSDGIYVESGGMLEVVADTSTIGPGESSPFSSFRNNLLITGDFVVFLAIRSDGNQGVYAYSRTSRQLKKVAVAGELLDGRMPRVFSFGPEGAGDGTFVMSVNFTDNWRALYKVDLTSNAAPVADAGTDQALPVGETALLNGALSSDDVTPPFQLLFQWTLESQPPGSTSTLSDASTVTPTFVPDMPGDYEIALVVTDGQGQSSIPDTVLVSAELDPAFVFERRYEGSSTYSSLYDRDDSFWTHSSTWDYWYAGALQNDSAVGHKYLGTYSYDSTTGAYSNNLTQAIGKLDALGEQLLVSQGDPIPGTTADTFRYLWFAGTDDDTVFFRGYGFDYYSFYDSLFSVDPATGTVANASVVPPVAVNGVDADLAWVYQYYWWGNVDNVGRYYQGGDGTCARTRTYTNYLGRTYQYCVYHRGLYMIESGLADRIVDNTMNVPGGDSNDYFYWFQSLTVDEVTGTTYFVGQWLEEPESRWRQGIFRRDSNGVLTRVLDDADVDWDRGWFNTIRFESGNLFAGGYRYQSGYNQGAWWSSYQQGIFQVVDGSAEPVVTGGGYSGRVYLNNGYKYLNSWVDTYGFEIGDGILAYNRHIYAYDSSTGVWINDSGAYWKEGGLERRIAGSNSDVLGKQYDWILSPGRSQWLEGRSVVLNAANWDYTSNYDPLEDRYTYSYASDRDVLIARFDTDRDGRGDDVDNCPLRPNFDQLDTDGDGIGDPCEDSDGDGVQDGIDNCPLDINDLQENNDGDAYGNACDVCVDEFDDQSDIDGDGLGDACDDNSDFDSYADALDNCPYTTNEDQSNIDGDLLGDVCDPDIDGDGIENEIDGLWDGSAYTDKSEVQSTDFSDHNLGGQSYGRILGQGQLALLVSDAADDEKGIVINAVNGTGNARIQQCDYRGQDAILDLQQGGIVEVTCGSILIESLAASAQLVLNGDVVVDIPQQVVARVVDIGTDEFVVENSTEAPLPLAMNLGPDIAVTIPSGSVGQVAEPAPGQFEIQNRTESAQPITAIQNGVEFVYQPGDVGVPVDIDIKPDSADNAINLGSNGVVPVAILTSHTFDATRVDPSTVTLASAPVGLRGKANLMASIKDINGDGYPDLVVNIETTALELEPDATGAVLKGSTIDGVAILGTDTIRVVPEG